MNSRTATALSALALAGNAAAFWRMPCRSPTGIARMDPIVFPGQIADHSHILFGSGNIGMTADYDTLVEGCTSCRVKQDKSGYWTPPLMFQFANGTVEMVQNEGGMLAYYLPYLSDIEPFPEGFAMLAGNPMLRNFTGPFPDTPLSFWPTDPTDQFFLEQRALGFNCLNYAKDPEPSLYRHFMPSKEYMDLNCKDGLRLEFAFPSCGNGSLTASDHKSHVKYPSLVKEGNCPEGYDHHYPFLFFETIYATDNYAGVDGMFLLATGDPTGSSYHGDFMMGWESAEFLGNALDTCTNQSGEIIDCPLFDIQSVEAGDQCTFDMPEALKNDNDVGPRQGLPVDVPIQWGPQPATAYPIAGANNVPTSSLPVATHSPASFSQPTLSYTSAAASLTSTALGGIVVDHASALGDSALNDANKVGLAASSAASILDSSASVSASPSSSVEASQVTHAPSPASEAEGHVVATNYVTKGHEVLAMVVEQVLVTVTADAAEPAATVDKRHLAQHVHHHHH